MADHDLFDVKDVTNEEDAIHLAVFYRKLLGAVKDAETMLAGYLAYTGEESFTVGSVTVQKKPGSKTYDHQGEVERFAGVSGSAAERVERVVEEHTEPKTSWSKVSKALGLKLGDIPFNQGDPKVEFVVDDTKVNTVKWEEHPDDEEAELVQPAPTGPAITADDEIPF